MLASQKSAFPRERPAQAEQGGRLRGDGAEQAGDCGFVRSAGADAVTDSSYHCT